MIAIEIENLSKVINDGDIGSKILDGINLTVNQGECIVIKGVSGSGKTTLLSLIAGLDRPSSGKVLIEGEPISKLPDSFASKLRAANIGMIFQHFNLLEYLSVSENVAIPLVPTGVKMGQITEQVKDALALANISHKADIISAKLSGGEKQRTAIARALVAQPNIVLCDEPTANLDRKNSLLFIEILKKLHKAGKTIIVATHDPLFDDLDFKNRVISMIDGRVV